jgi:hypothetical protein
MDAFYETSPQECCGASQTGASLMSSSCKVIKIGRAARWKTRAALLHLAASVPPRDTTCSTETHLAVLLLLEPLFILLAPLNDLAPRRNILESFAQRSTGEPRHSLAHV